MIPEKKKKVRNIRQFAQKSEFLGFICIPAMPGRKNQSSHLIQKVSKPGN
jgi:hypothetical protein